MEKRICNLAYWIGIVCTVVALVMRALAVVGIGGVSMTGGGIHPGTSPISYKSFLDGAILFFIMAIASSVALWTKAQES
ncbi:MAG: hypothetical protein WB762_34815 [Candidatus Sulfotelmatobacter sp.]